MKIIAISLVLALCSCTGYRHEFAIGYDDGKGNQIWSKYTTYKPSGKEVVPSK